MSYPVSSGSFQEQEPQWKTRRGFWGCNAFTNASTDFSLHPALTFAVAILLCFSLLCMSLLSSSSHIAVQSCIPLLSMRCRHVSELQASWSVFLCLSAWCRSFVLVFHIYSRWLWFICLLSGDLSGEVMVNIGHSCILHLQILFHLRGRELWACYRYSIFLTKRKGGVSGAIAFPMGYLSPQGSKCPTVHVLCVQDKP